MAWTVDEIISKFRDLTGRPSASQITDEDILAEINHYFQYLFPIEVGIPEFKGWYTFDTVAGVGFQDIPEDIKEISAPAYINNADVNFWIDVKRFYQQYPHDYTSQNTPTDILLLDRTLIIRPIPDDIFGVRLRKKSSTPDPLVSGETLDNSTWGPAIAYGSSITYAMDKGEDEVVDEIKAGYDRYISVVSEHVIRQQPTGKRPRGGRF